MLGTTCAWEIHGELDIFAAPSGVPNDDEWDRSLREIEAAKIKRILIAQIDAGQVHMSADRRKRTADLMKKLGTRQAVVTDHALSRGLITAMSWLGSDVRAFSWRDFDKAMVFLAMSDDEKLLTRSVLERLRSHIESVRKRSAV